MDLCWLGRTRGKMLKIWPIIVICICHNSWYNGWQLFLFHLWHHFRVILAALSTAWWTENTMCTVLPASSPVTDATLSGSPPSSPAFPPTTNGWTRWVTSLISIIELRSPSFPHNISLFLFTDHDVNKHSRPRSRTSTLVCFVYRWSSIVVAHN